MSNAEVTSILITEGMALYIVSKHYESYDLRKQLFSPETQVIFYNVFHLD
jgi:hypothetical protein